MEEYINNIYNILQNYRQYIKIIHSDISSYDCYIISDYISSFNREMTFEDVEQFVLKFPKVEYSNYILNEINDYILNKINNIFINMKTRNLKNKYINYIQIRQDNISENPDINNLVPISESELILNEKVKNSNKLELSFDRFLRLFIKDYDQDSHGYDNTIVKYKNQLYTNAYIFRNHYMYDKDIESKNSIWNRVTDYTINNVYDLAKIHYNDLYKLEKLTDFSVFIPVQKIIPYFTYLDEKYPDSYITKEKKEMFKDVLYQIKIDCDYDINIVNYINSFEVSMSIEEIKNYIANFPDCENRIKKLNDFFLEEEEFNKKFPYYFGLNLNECKNYHTEQEYTLFDLTKYINEFDSQQYIKWFDKLIDNITNEQLALLKILIN